MISYTLQILGHIGSASLQPDLRFDETDIAHFRAWPWLCDFNAHINNARYLTLMDWGRTRWITRSGFGKIWIKKRLQVVAAGSTIVFRRPIQLMEHFTLHTTIDSADERWLYFSQTFFDKNNKLAARALVRLAITKNGSPFSLEKITKFTEYSFTIPAVTKEAQALGEASFQSLKVASALKPN